MARQALFDGLVYDEHELIVETATVGGEAFYVIDDNGFHRHIDAEDVDRQVLSIFLDQLQDNKEMAVEQALKMLGKDHRPGYTGTGSKHVGHVGLPDHY